MISVCLFFLFFLLINSFSLKRQYAFTGYATLFLVSLLEGIFPDFTVPFFENKSSFLVPIFTAIFSTRLLKKEKDYGIDQKVFILFILFYFSGFPFIFLSLFWFFCTGNFKSEKFFILLSLGLLEVSSIIQERFIYALLTGLVFPCAREKGIEDYAIKSYVIFLFLEKIDSIMFSYAVLFFIGIRIISIFILMPGQKNILGFSRSFFSCAIVLCLFYEILTGIKMLQTSILLIMLLNVLVDSVVGRYFLQKDSFKIRSILGNRNFTIFFMFVLFLSPFNPVFINASIYLADSSGYPFLFMIFLFLILQFLTVSKISILIDDFDETKAPLPDFLQFLVLVSPFIFSALIIPENLALNSGSREIGMDFLKVFFLLSFFYLLMLFLVVYFGENIKRWIFQDRAKFNSLIESSDNALENTSRLAEPLTRVLHSLQSRLLQVGNGMLNLIRNKELNKINRHCSIDPSLGMGFLLTVLLMIVVYRRYGS